MVTTLYKKMKTRQNMQAGVTLIEMIIVVAIIALVSSVILFNYSDFSTNVSVRNLSQEVALAIRKAQTYATSVRTISGTDISTATFSSYGIHIDLDNPKQIVLFADNGGESRDRHYNQSDASCGSPREGNECIEVLTINTADKISEICWYWGAGNKACSTEQSDSTDILFTRPNPDAVLCMREECDGNIATIEIGLESAKGVKRSVAVYTTGQISVK